MVKLLKRYSVPKNDTKTILALAQLYYDNASLFKIAYIRKLPNGKYRVFSEKGKNLGTYDSHSEAKKRLQQIEMFKHMKNKKASSNIIDLSHLDDISYSSVSRELKKSNPEALLYFLYAYKKYFDKLVSAGNNNEDALPLAILITNKRFPLKLG